MPFAEDLWHCNGELLRSFRRIVSRPYRALGKINKHERLNFYSQLPLDRGMKAIIVDTSKTYLTAVRRLLAAALPDIEVTEYDAEQRGPPAADFQWNLYDVALLSDDLGDAPSGLEWLRRYRDTRGFPPVILVADRGDEYLAVAAIKAGAHDYLRKEHLTDARLGAMLQSAARAKDTTEVTQSLDGFVLQALDQCATVGEYSVASAGHRFVRLIGQGGFSRVYLAERAHDGATIVLKIIDTQKIQEPVAIQRFVREAEIISSIHDQHVVQIYDQGFTPDYGYISMEFFAHGDLKQRIERGVSVGATLNYMRAIACGLQAIHAQQVIHRDLKPSNLMFRADDTLALADFGISKRLHDTTDLTASSGILGTPSYIAPEQAQGEPVDARADLYSAGIIFYELLTGRKPYRAESAAGLVYQHVHAPVPQLPSPLAPIQPLLDLLLAKRAEDRFDSATEFLDSLEAWLPARFTAAMHAHTPWSLAA